MIDVPAFAPLNDFIAEISRNEQAHPGPAEVVFALLLSFGLNCLIATLYKRTYRGANYSQDYVHTLLILGTVVTVVIMVVSGNSATAFGMFAAFSIIRFRRSVGQSRDIGFIFFAMATGLAVGARAYVMAAVITPLVCLLILVLWSRDAFAPRRLSHHLRIRVPNEFDYDREFGTVFREFLSYHTLGSVETVQAGMMTELRYDITLLDPSRVGAFIGQLQHLNGNNRILVTSVGEAGGRD
jgi:hypothetical protein